MISLHMLRDEGKVNMGRGEIRRGGGGGGCWMDKEEGEQPKEIAGLVGEPLEGLARTVGGVKKVMKKREG